MTIIIADALDSHSVWLRLRAIPRNAHLCVRALAELDEIAKHCWQKNEVDLTKKGRNQISVVPKDVRDLGICAIHQGRLIESTVTYCMDRR
jgi:hypothetical protein